MKSIILIFCVCSVTAFAQQTDNSGFYHRTSIGILAGSSSNLSFNTANGIRFKNGWENGFGFGVERFYDTYTAPIFVESRVNFLRHKFEGTELFTGINLGYQSILGNYRNGEGYSTGINVGMTHYLTDHCAIYTSLGYRFVYLKESYTYGYPYYLMDIYYDPNAFETSEIHRIELKVGVRFH